jgi:hypothetical protein
MALKMGVAGVIILLLIGSISCSSGNDTPSTAPSIATIVAGGSQLGTPSASTATTTDVPTTVQPTRATTDSGEAPSSPSAPAIPTAPPPGNAQELPNGRYGLIRDEAGIRTTATLQEMNCATDDQIDLQTSEGRFLVQIPTFPGYDCARAAEALTRSAGNSNVRGMGIGLEYLRGEEGRSSQVIIGWESGGSNTLVVLGLYRPS